MAVPSVVIGPGRALDAYSIRARWAPVFLVVLPPLVLCFALVPGCRPGQARPLRGQPASLSSLISWAATGKAASAALWASWGGARRQQPSGTATLPIRSCSHASMSGSRQSWGTPCRPPDEERADPAGADNVYQAAIAVLDRQDAGGEGVSARSLPRIRNYGFRRNMLGLRRRGRLLAAAAGILALAANGPDSPDWSNIPTRPGQRRPRCLGRRHREILVAGRHAGLGPARRLGLRRTAT